MFGKREGIVIVLASDNCGVNWLISAKLLISPLELTSHSFPQAVKQILSKTDLESRNRTLLVRIKQLSRNN